MNKLPKTIFSVFSIFSVGIRIIIGFEILSILSFLLLGSSTFSTFSHHGSFLPSPWLWMNLMSQGFYAPVLTALFLLVGILASIEAWVRGGLWRWFFYLSLVGLFGLFIVMALSLWIFSWWMGFSKTPEPWQFFNIGYSLKRGTEIYSSFWYSFLGVLGLVMGAIAFHIFSKKRPQSSVFGSAHFANPWEIWKAGYWGREGLPIAKSWGRWLISPTEHLLVLAKTGGGKTLLSTAMLLTWKGSAVANDVKRTLFEKTSLFREKFFGQRCYFFAPSNPTCETHAYNPLSFIAKDKVQRIRDIQQMARIFVPDNNKTDEFWFRTSRALFIALVLYLLDTPDKEACLGELNRLVKQPNFDSWLAHIAGDNTQLDPVFYGNVHPYLNAHPKTRTGILQTFIGYFDIFDDPLIDAATSHSDFDLRNLRKERMTIYVWFPDHERERLAPLVTIFWQQLTSFMLEAIPNPQTEPYSLLCLMDEFASLGKLEIFRQSLKLLREYNVRCVLMLQYLAQTLEKYTEAEAKAFTNIKTKIAFTQDSFEDAEYFSRLLGTETRIIKAGSTSQHSDTGLNFTDSYARQATPLRRPEEILKLKPKKTLIVTSGQPSIQSDQLIWYEEKNLKNLPCGESTVPVQKEQKNQSVEADSSSTASLVPAKVDESLKNSGEVNELNKDEFMENSEEIEKIENEIKEQEKAKNLEKLSMLIEIVDVILAHLDRIMAKGLHRRWEEEKRSRSDE